MSISAEAFADAQEQELHNWDRHTGTPRRLLYELVEHSEIAGPLAERLPDRVGKALEVGVGCYGLGFLGPHLSDRIDHIDGLDPLPRLELDPPDEPLKTYLQHLQSRVNYVQAAGEELPLETGDYDLVASINVVDHAMDPPAILSEIRRVLKPGGVFAFSVSTLSKAGEWKWKADRKRHPDKWLYRAHPHTYQWAAADALVRRFFPNVLWCDEPSPRNKLLGKGRMSYWIAKG